MSQITNQQSSNRQPAYVAFNVRDRGKGKDSKWIEIGAAFPHKDGKGFDLLIDIVPLSGRITLRAPDKKPGK